MRHTDTVLETNKLTIPHSPIPKPDSVWERDHCSHSTVYAEVVFMYSTFNNIPESVLINSIKHTHSNPSCWYYPPGTLTCQEPSSITARSPHPTLPGAFTHHCQQPSSITARSLHPTLPGAFTHPCQEPSTHIARSLHSSLLYHSSIPIQHNPATLLSQ